MSWRIPASSSIASTCGGSVVMAVTNYPIESIVYSHECGLQGRRTGCPAACFLADHVASARRDRCAIGGTGSTQSGSRDCRNRRSTACGDRRPSDFIAGRDPGIQSSKQGANPRVAQIHQLPRDVGGPRLVRARAVEDDLAIRRQLVAPSLHVGEVGNHGTWNDTAVLVANERRAQVDDYRPLAFGNQSVQLIDAY